MGKQTMTQSLLDDSIIADLYRRSTRHGALRLSGQGRLPRDTLNEWLSQDRLYAQAYARFIGGLVSRVRLPQEVGAEGLSGSLEWRILCLLQKSLAGIMRELQFFEETAATYGLNLETEGQGESRFGPNATTKAYIGLFDSFTATARSDSPRSLFEGLVVLWTTEQAYVESWAYAKAQQQKQKQSSDSNDTNTGSSDAAGTTGTTTGHAGDLDGGALRDKLIPNWTSPEFHAFVREIRECLDEYEQRLTGEENADARFATAAAMMKKVLVLEEGFWPVTADDDGDED
ncbi:heme oxygenase-like protein [Xylariaceae sp. FL0594]|nr:heme oxygenase-like protein [Xylariaceae sp. FL0594]